MSTTWYNSNQWRIQDFPEWGAPTAKVGAPTYYFGQFSPKTAWNWRNLDWEGGRIPGAPLGSANAVNVFYDLFISNNVVPYWSCEASSLLDLRIPTALHLYLDYYVIATWSDWLSQSSWKQLRLVTSPDERWIHKEKHWKWDRIYSMRNGGRRHLSVRNGGKNRKRHLPAHLNHSFRYESKRQAKYGIYRSRKVRTGVTDRTFLLLCIPDQRRM